MWSDIIENVNLDGNSTNSISTEFNTTLGIKIKQIRNDNNLTQEEFCNRLDIKLTRGNLSKIELGKISPSAEFIKSVIESFDISPYWLLGLKNIEVEKDDKLKLKFDELDEVKKIKVEAYIDFLYLEDNKY